MHIKAVIAIAASAGVVNAAAHRHGHRHAHEQRDVVFLETDTLTETDWVTVTVDGDAPTTTSSVVVATLSSSSKTSTTSVPTVAASTSVVAASSPSPTTLQTVSSASPVVFVAKSTTTSVAVASVAQSKTSTSVAAAKTTASTTTAAPAASTSAATSASTGSTTSGNKRGAAYNTASLITPLLGAKSKLSWAYNWGQVRDTGLATSLEFVPMLWGDKQGMASGWAKNAATAIAAGSKNLLSVNEPDNAGQSDMTPAVAAAFHQTNMNPFSGKARIGSPAITNSGAADEGVNWLTQFFTACNGKCAVDFCVAHWYATPSTSYFLSFLQQVNTACQGKPVWLTEFAPSGSADDISKFLTTVQDQLDNNATYSFVERYSYFMVSEGSLVQGGAPTEFGNTFAFA